MREEAPTGRGLLVLILAFVMAVAVVMVGTDTAQAAKTDPELTLLTSAAEINRAGSGCDYRGTWSLNDVHGRFAYVSVQYQTSESAGWVDDGIREVDQKSTQTLVHTVDIIGVQPTSVSLRATVVKKNGSLMTEYSETQLLSCSLTETIT